LFAAFGQHRYITRRAMPGLRRSLLLCTALLCATCFLPVSLAVLLVAAPLYALGAAAVFACNLVRAANFDRAASLKLARLAVGEAWWMLANARLVGAIRWYYLRTAPADNVCIDIGYRSGDVPLSAAVTERCKLDVYHHGVGLAAKPVLLFVYGGGWGSGDKWIYSKLAALLRRECDAVVVVFDYAIFPAATMVDMVRAVNDAVQWTSSNIGRYGGDAKRMTGVGHSAGAHLLVMYALRWAMSRAEVALPPALQDTAVDEALGCSSPIFLLASPLRKPGTPDAFDSPPFPTDPLSLSDMARDGRECAARGTLLHGVVAFSGVYDLPAHIKVEEDRGIERLSAMTAATGGHWCAMSPTLLVDALSDAELTAVGNFMPSNVRIAHGDSDTSIKLSQSHDLVRATRRGDGDGRPFDFEVMEGISHSDVVFGPLTDAAHPTIRIVANVVA
jgi:acetyl esterase/lipase